MEDKRNQLYMQFVRLLRGLQPKVFVMENVSGLVKGKMKLIFADIMRELKASGYNVRCKLLNVMYFNVPQSRQRLVFIGMREDFNNAISFPSAKNKPIVVRSAIGDLEMVREKLKLNNIQNWDGRHAGRFSSIRINANRPSPTLTKTNRPNSTTGLNHYKYPQSLSINEMKRIQSFPDSFLFAGKAYSTRSARIGDSVPPLFMRSIANHIRCEILA